MKSKRYFAAFFLGLMIASLSARATMITWSPFPSSPAYVGQSLDFGFSAEDHFVDEFIGLDIYYATDKIDFGDGAFILGGYGSHIYLTPGIYTVTGFYSNDFGYPEGGTASRSLEILAVPDSGATFALLGFALTGLWAFRRKFGTT